MVVCYWTGTGGEVDVGGLMQVSSTIWAVNRHARCMHSISTVRSGHLVSCIAYGLCVEHNVHTWLHGSYGVEHSGFEMGRCVCVEWNRVGGGNGETGVLCGRHHV